MKKYIRPLLVITTASLLAVPTSVVSHADSNTNYVEHTNTDQDRFYNNMGFETLTWKGHEWGVRQPNDIVFWGGPQAENPRTGQSEWIHGATVNDNGDLVLENKGIDGAVELNMNESTGYGSYSFTYSGDFNNMNPHNVLGIFTYDMSERFIDPKTQRPYTRGDGYTEIDFIEISRWGDEDRKYPHAGVTYYPDDGYTVKPDSIHASQYNITQPGMQTLTTTVEWKKDFLHVKTTDQNGNVIDDVTSTERVPVDRGTQQLRINLWTTAANSEKKYYNATGDTIVFHDFSYTPEINDNTHGTSETTTTPLPPTNSSPSTNPIYTPSSSSSSSSLLSKLQKKKEKYKNKHIFSSQNR